MFVKSMLSAVLVVLLGVVTTCIAKEMIADSQDGTNEIQQQPLYDDGGMAGGDNDEYYIPDFDDELTDMEKRGGVRPVPYPCNGYDYLPRCLHGGRGPRKTWTKAGQFCVCLCPSKWSGPECSFAADNHIGKRTFPWKVMGNINKRTFPWKINVASKRTYPWQVMAAEKRTFPWKVMGSSFKNDE